MKSEPRGLAASAAAAPLTRRQVVRALGAGLVALPMGSALAACAGAGADDAGTAGDGGANTDAGVAQGDGGAQNSGDAGSATAWALGGTAAMTAQASYPNPFTSGLAENSCDLTCQLTLGPCYAPSAPTRQDVSEGEPGIPVRLMMKVVEADGCTPVAGAELEIWYCDIEGLYSGDDVNQGDFCTAGDERAEAAYYARGRNLTDDEGVVTFDCTFPGWYAGRAVHIHFLVRRAAFVGGVQDTEAAVVSQLFFPEGLTDEIFSDVEGYLSRGQPDTTFATDTVIGGVDDTDAYVVGYQRMRDGAMLAWKTVAISDTESCGSAGGGEGPGGGGGGGGEPPGGFLDGGFPGGPPGGFDGGVPPAP